MTSSADPIERLRYLLYAGFAAMLLAGALVAWRFHTHWSWGLFAWGLALGVGAILHQEALFAVAPQGVLVHERLATRRKVLLPVLLAIGATIGLAAGAFDAVAIDITFSIFAVLVWAASFATAPLIARRARRGSGGEII